MKITKKELQELDNNTSRLLETIDLGQECGLAYTGEIKDGEPQFIGDNRAWNYFNNGGKY